MTNKVTYPIPISKCLVYVTNLKSIHFTTHHCSASEQIWSHAAVYIRRKMCPKYLLFEQVEVIANLATTFREGVLYLIQPTYSLKLSVPTCIRDVFAILLSHSFRVY